MTRGADLREDIENGVRQVARDVYFRSDIACAIRGIYRAMSGANRSDDYKEAVEDFAAALSDTFGIGDLDEHGDLRNIGRFTPGDNTDPRHNSDVQVLSLSVQGGG